VGKYFKIPKKSNFSRISIFIAEMERVILAGNLAVSNFGIFEKIGFLERESQPFGHHFSRNYAKH
jgi:hypothetical protein